MLFKKYNIIMKYFKCGSPLSQILYILCVFQHILHFRGGNMIFSNRNLHLISWNLFLYFLYFSYYEWLLWQRICHGTHLQLTLLFHGCFQFTRRKSNLSGSKYIIGSVCVLVCLQQLRKWMSPLLLYSYSPVHWPKSLVVLSNHLELGISRGALCSCSLRNGLLAF